MFARPLQGLVDGFLDFVAGNPVFVGLVVALLVFIFFMYLFLRRTLTGLRDGYDEGYRGK